MKIYRRQGAYLKVGTKPDPTSECRIDIGVELIDELGLTSIWIDGEIATLDSLALGGVIAGYDDERKCTLEEAVQRIRARFGVEAAPETNWNRLCDLIANRRRDARLFGSGKKP